MNRIARPFGKLAPIVAIALVGVAGEAQAQATITGRVTNEAGAPLAGATVAITTLGVGSQAGPNGTYSFVVPSTLARGQRVNLTARYIGFKPVEREITLAGPTVTENFALVADPFRLDELVVTGVSTATSKRNLAFSVAQVSAEQVSTVPASSPLQALQGKVAGARIGFGTGNPGSNPVIRLRGSTNLQIGGSAPLIIVDGVITNGSLADIDAQTIESVEVLKGPAAASFYGSDAANGVVNITTKRGRNVADGETRFLVRTEYGQSGLQRMVPLNRYHHFDTDPTTGEILLNPNGSRKASADGIADNPFPTSGLNVWRNQLEEFIENGSFSSTTAQLSLRRGNTNVGTSFSFNNEGGLLPFRDGQTRRNARLNVDQGIGEKLDLSVSMGYNINRNDYSPGSSAGWFEILQAPPDLDLRNPNNDPSQVPFFPRLPAASSPSARGNPLYSLANAEYELRRERLLGSATARYRPLDWLRFEGTYGTDRLNSRAQSYTPRGFLNNTGTPGGGAIAFDTDERVDYNIQGSAIATKTFGALNSTTRLTYLYESTESIGVNASGSNFRVSELPNIAAVASEDRTGSNFFTDLRTRDYFVAQDFEFKDRYILSGLYRRDGSSLFGANERWADFYRIAGAYIISEDFQMPGVDLLKIRAARGTAGLRPSFAWQYETYSLSGGNPSKSTIGNNDLRPAVVAENEFGLEMAFLGRFNAEVVYAARKTDGAFLNIPLSSARSNGFTSQWQNAADISGNTFELLLSALVINRPDLTYNLTLTADRTRQQIDRMNRAPYRVNAGGQGQDVFYYAAGQPLGLIYGTRFVRSPQELLDNPANANNPAFNVNDYIVNPDGYVVRAASRTGDLATRPAELPIKYVDGTGNDQFVIGDVNPDFGFGIANTVGFKGFSVYALVDGVQGGDIYNFTKQWMYQDFRHGTLGQADRPVEERVPISFYATGLYNALNAANHFVEDGSFVKLRELSVSYTFGANMLSRFKADRYVRGAKIALIGRNLLTWTKYSGFDPDVASGGDFNFRIDGFRYPAFRQFSGQVELTF